MTKLNKAITLLDLIEDSIESATYSEIYYNGMTLLYEFRRELDDKSNELNKGE